MKKKQILCLFLALAMAAALFACGNGESGGESTAPTSDPYPTEDGALTPFPESVTLTMTKRVDPNTTFINGESQQNNFISKLYKEVLNVEWKNTWEADYAAYYTKLNLDIASNELPDVFMVSAQQLQNLIINDQIMDLSAVYQHYASDLLKKNIEYDDKYLLKYPTVDGKLYAIPLTTAYENDAAFLWLRTDWMNELKLTPPTTAEEFSEYVKAVRDSGIAGSGTSGFSFLGVGSVSFDALIQTKGAYFDCWLEKDGKLVYGSIQPEMRDALLMLQKMYQEGVIDQDFASKSLTEQEAITRSMYGVVFGQYFYPYQLKGSVKNGAQWDAYPIPSANGNDPKPASSGFSKGYVVVNKNCANPAAVIKSMNLWGEIWLDGGSYNEWYAERFGTTYKNVSVIGEYALPYTFDDVDSTTKTGVKFREIFAAADPEKYMLETYPELKYSYALLADTENPNYISGNGWFLKTMYMTSERVMDENYQKGLVLDAYQGMLSEDMGFTKPSLDKEMYEVFNGIIIGDPIENFDTFVTDWYSLGGEDLEKEVNAWYQNNQ